MQIDLACVCGETLSNQWAIVDGINIVECQCGVKRVKTIDDSYTSRYASGDYHSEDRTGDTGHKAHADRIDHDFTVAVQRLNKLNRFQVSRSTTRVNLLDVGCSNGAFMIAAAKSFGFNVYGCDLSTDAVAEEVRMRAVKGTVEKCGFPRRTFHVITFNDVLEHIPDPKSALLAAKGLLRRDGILVVEIPDMGCASAKAQGAKFKHVKPHEHLWYWNANQLRTLLEQVGFTVVWMDVPIPGKVTAYAMPSATVEEVIIYSPPGTGDIMWTMCKLRGIREREAPCTIKYVVCVEGQSKLATRSRDFLLMSTLVDAVDFQDIPMPRDIGNPDPRLPVYELLANNWLEPQKGLLENWRPELATDFDIGIEVPEAAMAIARARLPHGPKYVAVYMSSHTWNQFACLPDWMPKDWASLIIALVDSGYKPIIIGAGWDAEFVKDVGARIVEMGRDPAKLWINLVGRTPMAQAMAYMKLAVCTVGICAGIVMIPAHMGWPTVLLWPTIDISDTSLQYTVEFCDNWVPPAVRHSGSYNFHPVGGLTVDKIIQSIKDVTCEK